MAQTLTGSVMKHGIVIIAALLLSACSSQVLLTIESEPPGAAVFEGGRFWGHAPVTLSYTPSNEFQNGGCMGTKPIMVEWDSGAQARVTTINVCGVQQRQQEFLFTYPEGFPSALGTSTAAANGGVQPPLRRVAPNGQLYWEVTHTSSESTVRCYSDMSGDTVTTNCS
jgi:hypothetical protein